MKCKCCNNEALKYSRYSNGEFCSKKCARSFSTKNENNKKKISKCSNCNSDFDVDKRCGVFYCDNCKKEKLNKKRKIRKEKIIIIKNKRKVLGDIFYCKDCGELIEKRKSYCKSCISKHEKNRVKNNNYNYDYVLNWRNNNKKLAVEYKGGKCDICGYNKSMRSLQFHHLDPSKKEITISKKINSVKFEKLKFELDKCILVCANCHGEIHDGLIEI